MKQIEKGLSFESSELDIDLKTYTNAIEHYYKNFKDSVDLKNNIPIFLDTNILLRFYSISFKQRELLTKFFNDNIKNLYISGQVQKEFIKNREEVIQKYFHSALESMSENLKSDVIDKTNQYKNNHKEVLKDFDYIEKAINSQLKSFDKITEKLKKDIDALRIKNKELTFTDDFLNLINQFDQTYRIDSNESEFLKKEFNELCKNIDKSKLKNDLAKKTNFAIPGIADILEKPDNPFGDYFIYHELIKCSLDKNTDILFLTYDTTKGDWIKTNKEPHNHYILRTFQITNKSIYIIDAERFFEKQLKTNFESLINNDSNNSIFDFQEIILDYITLEKIIRAIAEFICIDKSEILPLNQIMYQLIDRDIIDENIYRDFSNVTQVKNQLTHRTSDFLKERYSDEFLLRTSLIIESLINYFNKIYSEL